VDVKPRNRTSEKPPLERRFVSAAQSSEPLLEIPHPIRTQRKSPAQSPG
jgi:hypothetical protein